TLEDRLQKRRRRAPAASPALVDLEITRALVVALIEVVDLRNADFDPCLPHGVEDRPGDARTLDPPLAADPVQRAAAVMVLLPQEVRQDVIPAPAGKAKLAPAVVVGRLAAHIDHGVDRGRAAHHPAARIGYRTAAKIRLRRGLEHPVRARIADGVEIADRDMEPDPVVAAAGLDEENAVAGVAAQPIGEHAACRAGADDDEVVNFLAHGVTAQQATSRPRLRSSGGFSARQRSKTSGQRGWKGHPAGGANGDGGSPDSRMRWRLAVGSATGVADRSAWVYGCCGRSKIAARSPSSTVLPR